MTKPHALKLLKSGYFKIQALARDMYQDNAPDDTKRMRLNWKIKQESIGEEEINFLEKILK